MPERQHESCTPRLSPSKRVRHPPLPYVRDSTNSTPLAEQKLFSSAPLNVLCVFSFESHETVYGSGLSLRNDMVFFA